MTPEQLLIKAAELNSNPVADSVTQAVPVFGSFIQQLRDLHNYGPSVALDRQVWIGHHPLQLGSSIAGGVLGGSLTDGLTKLSPRFKEMMTKINKAALGRHSHRMMPNFAGKMLMSTLSSMVAGNAAQGYLSGSYTNNKIASYQSPGQRESDSRIAAGMSALIPSIFNYAYGKVAPFERPLVGTFNTDDAAKLQLLDKLKSEGGAYVDKYTDPVSPRRRSLMGDLLSKHGPHYMETDKGIGRVLKHSIIPWDQLKSKPTGVVNMGKFEPTAHVMAHEIGHHMQPGWMKGTYTRAGLRAGPILGAMFPVLSNDETTGLVGAGAGTMAAIPGLIGEYDASRRGAGLLKPIYDKFTANSPEMMMERGPKGLLSKYRGLRKLGPYVGLPTYIAAAATPALAYAGRKLSGGYDKPTGIDAIRDMFNSGKSMLQR